MRSTSRRPVRQAGQRVVGRLLGEGGLGVLQVGHPLGLGLAEPGDLAVLGLLGAEVGEREAGEVVAVDLERRGADQDRERPRRRRRAGRTRRWRRARPDPGSRPARSGRPPATNIASGDPTIVSRAHDSSSASRRLAYRMSPLDESVAAPSRMFSTNIRYGRSAVDSVNTRRPRPPSETTKASTSPAPIARSVSSASAIRASASARRRRHAVAVSSTATISTSAASARSGEVPARGSRHGRQGSDLAARRGRLGDGEAQRQQHLGGVRTGRRRPCARAAAGS